LSHAIAEGRIFFRDLDQIDEDILGPNPWFLRQAHEDALVHTPRMTLNLALLAPMASGEPHDRNRGESSILRKISKRIP
jgi:hypothetical protein